LAIDANDNGVFDAGDDATPFTLTQLVFWDRVPEAHTGELIGPINGETNADKSWFATLYTDAGEFAYKNLPAGRYYLTVWWEGGFVGGGLQRDPAQFRAIFDVGADGAVRAPDPVPADWPRSEGEDLERINVAADHVALGALADPILLKTAKPGVVQYPVGDSAAVDDRGVLDVGAILASFAAPPVQQPPAAAPPRNISAPDTGVGPSSRSVTDAWMTVIGLTAAGTLAALLGRRIRHRSC
jgi:hypothetical protein